MSQMGMLFRDMGVIRWPLLFSLLAIVAISSWSAWRVYRSGAAPDLRTKTWIDAILFWGGFAMIAGILGTVMGVILAAQSIEQAGQVQTTLVWGGVKVAMLSTAFGTLMLAGAALAWFVLQLRWRLLEAREADAIA